VLRLFRPVAVAAPPAAGDSDETRRGLEALGYVE
jgi:hypothetical protein